MNETLTTGRAVSILMLTLNEEGAIAKVVADIRRVLPESEIVVVDSSKDRTPEIAKELGCIVVRQFPPRGYGNAMDAGFKACSREFVVTLDCDDTYPVDAINEMLVKADQGCDLVSASRLGSRPESMRLANYIANKVFAYLALFLCGCHSTDVHTGMRLYRKSLLDSFSYEPEGMALPVEMQVGPASLGFRCEETFIEYKPRIGESKMVPLPGTIWTLRRLWTWRTFFNPKRSKAKQELAAKQAL